SNAAGNEERAGIAGHRHGSRMRSLTGTFGPIEIAVPRARLTTTEGKASEWKSQALRAYQRRTLADAALIASTYLVGTNTRRVRGRPEGCARDQEPGRRERRGLAHCPGRSRHARTAAARVPDCRWRSGARQGHCQRLGWRAGATLHRSQAQKPVRARARAPA